MADVEVQMGVSVVTTDAGNLVASGIGSCLVVTLYDPKLGIGALAHAMLSADSRAANSRSGDARYVNIAIDEMIKGMTARGSERKRMEAKLVGGASMFPGLGSDMGMANVASARRKLKEQGIKVVAESVGGSLGRSVEFAVPSGIVTVKMKF